ncbi:MAG: membrane-associated protein [Halobacteria archaeon]|nr:membrane-associated protein [Halobacteria archaeon]
MVPVYWAGLGVDNFLWGSDIALLVMVFGLWLESRFLASMMAVGVLIPELAWNIDYFTHLIAGRDVLGLNVTGYMFSEDRSLLVRSMSLFHVFLPVILLYSLMRLGYDTRAFLAQMILCWLVLPASYLFTEPAKNINWVFGITEVPQTWMPEIAYLLLLMVLFPLLIFWPTHLLLKTIFNSTSNVKK